MEAEFTVYPLGLKQVSRTRRYSHMGSSLVFSHKSKGLKSVRGCFIGTDKTPLASCVIWQAHDNRWWQFLQLELRPSSAFPDLAAFRWWKTTAPIIPHHWPCCVGLWALQPKSIQRAWGWWRMPYAVLHCGTRTAKPVLSRCCWTIIPICPSHHGQWSSVMVGIVQQFLKGTTLATPCIADKHLPLLMSYLSTKKEGRAPVNEGGELSILQWIICISLMVCGFSFVLFWESIEDSMIYPLRKDWSRVVERFSYRRSQHLQAGMALSWNLQS